MLEVSVQYRQPLRFDDEVDVSLRVGAVRGATFQIAYLLTVGGQARATAVTVHGCVDGRGPPGAPAGLGGGVGHAAVDARPTYGRNGWTLATAQSAETIRPKVAAIAFFAATGSSARATTMPACMMAPSRRCDSGSTARLLNPAGRPPPWSARP